MQLPQRIQNHVTETSSYKIFSRCIPDHWIIRDITERDYGVDCYIELVNDENQVTGELISIQLKGTNNIAWTQQNTFTFSGVKISTSNYWKLFPVPVFICLVDTTKEEVYYCPVRSAIRKDYVTYAKQQTFSYKFKKEDRMELTSLTSFVDSYFTEKRSAELERNLTTFISHYAAYKEFVEENTYRDVFMGVEYSRILYLKHFYQNIQFLCNYFKIPWKIDSLKKFFKKSQEIFGDNYDLYEQQLHEIVVLLDAKLLPILLKLRDHITEDEKSYWIVHDLTIYNVMINVRDDGRMSIDW